MKRFLLVLSLAALASGCAPGPARLDSGDVQKLSALTPVTVVYVEPSAALDAGLSGQSGGGELGALKVIHGFQALLEPYQARAQELGVPDRQYEAVHAALSAVTWLKDATWKRIKKKDSDFNEFNFQLVTSEQAVGRVVIVIEANTSVQSYVDAMHANVNIDIYTKKVATSTERPAHFQSVWFDGAAGLGNPGPELGSNGRQPPDAEVKARLDRLFGGDSTPFLSGLDEALTSLKAQLTAYFSGSAD
jgi:hypothetical protein